MFDYEQRRLTCLFSSTMFSTFVVHDVSGGDVDVRGLYDQVSESRRREKKFKTQLLQSKAEVNSLRTTLDRLVQGGTAVSVFHRVVRGEGVRLTYFRFCLGVLLGVLLFFNVFRRLRGRRRVAKTVCVVWCQGRMHEKEERRRSMQGLCIWSKPWR